MINQPPETNHQEKFSRYVDPTGEFTNQDLNLGEWYIRHRVMLREIVVGILVTVIAVFGGYSVYKLTEYAFFGYSHDNRVLTDLTRNTVALKSIHASEAPTPLEIASVEVYPGVTGKYDLVAMAKNVNEQSGVIVSYNFTFDQGETPVFRALILPNTTLPLSALGTPAQSAPNGASLVIKSVEWNRLDDHLYPNPINYQAERLQFTISNFAFAPTNPALGTSANHISFKLKNESAYGYVQASFFAVLKNADTVVGVKRFFMDSFRAGETRQVDLTSFADSLVADGIEIIPDIDIFASDSYLPAGT